MSRRVITSFRVVVATGLAVLLGHSLTPIAASAMDRGAVDPRTIDTKSLQVQAERTKARLLRPNLIALKANDLSIQRSSRGRLLRFESGLGNVGRGPIEVRPNTRKPCPTGKHHASQIIYRDVDRSRFYKRSVDTSVARRSAGCMVFHPAHDHWHFQAAARYSLFQPGKDRDVVRVARRKMSFCLRDSRRVPEHYGRFRYPETYGACTRRSPQGISIGWVDIYQSYLAGQALRLPRRARDGFYCLETRVDPQDELIETDNRDNTSMRAFELEGDQIHLRRAKRCT